jgi:mono/diheme cytochrome c family protein
VIRLPVLALAAAAWLAGCDQMARQPKDPVYGRSALFADGSAMQAPPAFTVARDDAAWERALQTRPPMTAQLLARGRERYQIFCLPCHDPSGGGQGEIPARGFPHPPSFHSPRLIQAPSSHFVDVITNGYGVMYPYRDRVRPADRWAIAAYIRALQLSQRVPEAQLSAGERAKVEAAR